MVKNTFIYLVIILLVGLTIWFFIRKARNVSDSSTDLTKLVAQEEVSPTSAPTTEGKETWLKLPTGLEIMDVSIGYGREAKEGDVVAAHYTGTLTDGQKFDSSVDRGQPFSFILGGGMVIKGWDLGLVGMKVGGKRKLRIPPNLAYGDKVVGNGLIPANSTLLFDIELMAVETPKQQPK